MLRNKTKKVVIKYLSPLNSQKAKLGHRRNTFCDVTAIGQRYLSLFDRMKEIASFAASPLARVYETLRPCLLWNFTSSLRLSETSFL